MPMRVVMLVMLAIGRMVLAGLAMQRLLEVGWSPGALPFEFAFAPELFATFLILMLVVVRLVVMVLVRKTRVRGV